MHTDQMDDRRPLHQHEQNDKPATNQQREPAKPSKPTVAGGRWPTASNPVADCPDGADHASWERGGMQRTCPWLLRQNPVSIDPVFLQTGRRVLEHQKPISFT